MIENPFNITFGSEPNSIISRIDEFGEIFKSFSSTNPNSPVYILTGVRGCGKTVAMTTISEYYKKNNWIIIELNPESDMLEQLASKLYDEGHLKKYFIKPEFSFSFNGIGFNLSGDEPITNVSILLKKEFEILKKKNVRTLITIDEVVSNSYLKFFSHEVQIFFREKYNICLLLTGLYQNISLLENQKCLTFLYRAPKIYLSKLNIVAIANSYKNIFDIDKKTSIKIAKYTNGYAFAYQLLGNILFEENKKDIDTQVIQKYDELLYARAYSIIFSELSKREKEILMASTIDPSNDYIINNIKMSKNQLSNYKRNLVLKGIIESNREEIVFTLPRFTEFLKFVKIYEDIE